ncbi:MAG: methyltransferase domain-containing protein [Blastocatellia bacterium]|nr:methyltransferase domain-containing protein [Blastocatellia bacterium]
MNENETKKSKEDAKEEAFLYDLYIVPEWREAFDSIVDEEVKLPEEGKFLDAGCGTGGYAIDLAIRGGKKVEVIGLDASPERLALARGKAEIKKLQNVTFEEGSLSQRFPAPMMDDEFDLVIGDATMMPASEIGPSLEELARVAKKGATVALKLTTRGSFDELFSIYWEALYNLNIVQYTPQLEDLITERLTVSESEGLASRAGLKQVRSVTRKERFDYPDAGGFFEAPLIRKFFLDEWLAVLPDEETRSRVQEQMAAIIERDRQHLEDEPEIISDELKAVYAYERQKPGFDVSIKATVVIGLK